MRYFYLGVKTVPLWLMAGVPWSKGRYSRMLGRCSAPCALYWWIKCPAPCALRPCLDCPAPCALVLRAGALRPALFYYLACMGKRKGDREPWPLVPSIELSVARLRLTFCGIIILCLGRLDRGCRHIICRHCIGPAALLPCWLGIGSLCL